MQSKRDAKAVVIFVCVVGSLDSQLSLLSAWRGAQEVPGRRRPCGAARAQRRRVREDSREDIGCTRKRQDAGRRREGGYRLKFCLAFRRCRLYSRPFSSVFDLPCKFDFAFVAAAERCNVHASIKLRFLHHLIIDGNCRKRTSITSVNSADCCGCCAPTASPPSSQHRHAYGYHALPDPAALPGGRSRQPDPRPSTCNGRRALEDSESRPIGRWQQPRQPLWTCSQYRALADHKQPLDGLSELRRPHHGKCSGCHGLADLAPRPNVLLERLHRHRPKCNGCRALVDIGWFRDGHIQLPSSPRRMCSRFRVRLGPG